jgi:4-diphosphocytidyl-2-C-methyl-D-erythritol kinase
MKILSPAKINLFLKVGSLEKGFHNLISLVDIVDLYDTIEISESPSTKVHFYPRMNIPVENTVERSIKLLRSLFHIEKNVCVKIFKKIPTGSGLAGGSSNAASVLKSLVKMWNISVSIKELMDIGREIGKDVPLFIYGKRCIMEGFGEKITRVRSKQPLAYSLLAPPFGVSTKEVYARFDALGLKGSLTGVSEKIKLLDAAIEKKDIQKIEQIMENNLEDAYFNLWNCSKEVRDCLQRGTGKKFFVSGSGGALFSVFLNRREAEEKTSLLNIKGWKRWVVESIQTS